ncbi:MAG TPA: LysM peptidoglycan-binding domain-containing protein [Candidatus Deferrimicrobium sp.]|nr:LysM peptidoglycan-binding domain-containing protein [Candidatus Deferrimicrobium sp.]
MKTRRKWNPRNLILFLSVILLTTIVLLVSSSLSPTEAAGNKTFQPVLIHEGDTLWNLACKYVPNEDPRKVIHNIIEVNNLNDPTIRPGLVLKIPLEN